MDDASTDGTAHWVRLAHPEVTLVRLDRNRGFCGAINAGLRVARGAVAETLNNDTVVTAGWADEPLRRFADPSVGSVAPLVELLGRGVVDSAGSEYQIDGWWADRGQGRRPEGDLLREAEVFGASASAAFYRLAALRKVGLFPERFGAYSDDVDVAFRLRAAGYRCVYVPASRVLHREGHSHDHRGAALVAQVARNEERVFWGAVPPALRRRGMVPHLLRVAGIVACRLARRDQGLAYLRGKLSLLGELPALRAHRRHLRRLAQEAARPPEFPLTAAPTPLLARVGAKLRRSA